MAGLADEMGERVGCVVVVGREEAAEHGDGRHQIEYNRSDFERGQGEARCAETGTQGFVDRGAEALNLAKKVGKVEVQVTMMATFISTML